ncbi:aminotransferase class III-fold pyridoxal phosphate-dependent enzyme [Novosphingobium sp. 1949]|uniref:Aminotransferase class III-fold pyridoxal phosphate-dependent enzyme n=1 Tax=Novosphingobium organovorum TaxID=2930092 RepID=A0ABT0BAS7_9SPHN|nr:aminotransferase class III-fold pyridoxal phosphate-dependent enzyme [Novosphingobium organovorum]MCJ2182166.1 aminotransferase class III-fold pyridoxal phosphate-dependent enzyme [Novosphingobium organovorum]
MVKSLLERRTLALPRGLSSALPVFAVRGDDAQIWDETGKRYIDFAGGIAVPNSGHRHARIVAAVERQLGALMHMGGHVAGHPGYVELAERLNALAPLGVPTKSMLCTTGAQAVENAIRIAQAATGRQGIITFTAPAPAGSGPVSPASVLMEAPYAAPSLGVGRAQSLAALGRMLRSAIAPREVAALVVEPVLSAGGPHVAPASWLRELRRTCNEFGIVMIADETSCALGSTGCLFAIEHAGLAPDLLTLDSGLGGGVPVAALVGRADLMDIAVADGVGGAFAASPLSCAAALETLDLLASQHLLARARPIGAQVVARLSEFAGDETLAPIGNVRHIGAMIAFDMPSAAMARQGARQGTGYRAGQGAGQGRARDGATRMRAMHRHALEAGLIVRVDGAHKETCRILVPLTASDAVIAEGMECLRSALALA